MLGASLDLYSHKVKKHTAFVIHSDAVMYHEEPMGMAWPLEPPNSNFL